MGEKLFDKDGNYCSILGIWILARTINVKITQAYRGQTIDFCKYTTV
jgi:hypothetical protein